MTFYTVLILLLGDQKHLLMFWKTAAFHALSVINVALCRSDSGVDMKSLINLHFEYSGLECHHPSDLVSNYYHEGYMDHGLKVVEANLKKKLT